MADGLAQVAIGAGGVASDERTGMTLDRKAYPRAMAVKDYDIFEIEETDHGQQTGAFAWPNGKDTWNTWRDVMPAVPIEHTDADAGDDPDGEIRGPWRPLWDGHAVDHALQHRAAQTNGGPIEDVRYAGDNIEDDRALLPPIPGSWPSVVVRGSNHNSQRPVAFPMGAPHVVQHSDGAPKYSGYAYEIHSETIDHNTRARFSSMEWVKRLPGGEPTPIDASGPPPLSGEFALAFNCTRSGGAADGYGLFVGDHIGTITMPEPGPQLYREGPDETADDGLGDDRPRDLPEWKRPKNLLGFLSHEMGGFLNAGVETDQHKIATNADGEPLIPGHASINMIRNIPGVSPLWDAPAEHSLAFYEPAAAVGAWHRTEIRYDPNDAHAIPPLAGTFQGLWKRETRVPIITPVHEPPTIVPPPTEKIPGEREGPPVGGGPNGGGVTTPGANGNGGGLPGAIPVPPAGQRGSSAGGRSDPGGTGPVFTPPLGTPPGHAGGFDPLLEGYGRRVAHGSNVDCVPPAGTYFPWLVPSTLFQPDPRIDFDAGVPGDDDERDQAEWWSRPGVLRISGFGKRDGAPKGSNYALTTGRGTAYPKHRTGPGGVFVSPAEASAWDHSPSVRSSVYFGLSRDVTLAFGTPDVKSGTMVDGPRLVPFDNGSGDDDLRLRFVDDAGAARSDGHLEIVGDVSATNALFTTVDFNQSSMIETDAIRADDGTVTGTAGTILVGTGVYVQGKLTVTGLIDPTGLVLSEQSADPGSTGAGEGTFWTKDDAPTTPYFTDDGGTDHQLAYGSDVTDERALKASITANVSVSTTTTETAVVTFDVPAGLIETGDVIEVRYSANAEIEEGSDTLTLRTRWDWGSGNVLIQDWDATTISGTATTFDGLHYATARTNSFMPAAHYFPVSGAAFTKTIDVVASSTTTFASAATIAFTAQWSTGSASLTFLEAMIKIHKKAT